MSTSIQRSPPVSVTAGGGTKAGVGVSGTIESQMRPGVGVTGANGVGKGSGEDGVEVGDAKGGGVGEAGSGVGEVVEMLVANCKEKVKEEAPERGRKGVGVEIAERTSAEEGTEISACPSDCQRPTTANRQKRKPGTRRNHQKGRFLIRHNFRRSPSSENVDFIALSLSISFGLRSAVIKLSGST